MLLDSFGKDGISTRALLVFLGEDLGQMGVRGFIFIISESPPAAQSGSELLFPLASTPRGASFPAGTVAKL